MNTMPYYMLYISVLDFKDSKKKQNKTKKKKKKKKKSEINGL